MAFLKLRVLRPLALVLSLVMAFCFGIAASDQIKIDVYLEHIIPVAINFGQVKHTRDPSLARKQIDFAYNSYARRYVTTHILAVLAANYALPLESARVLRHSLHTLPPIGKAELILVLVEDLRNGDVSEPVFRRLYRLDDDQFGAAQQCYNAVFPETADYPGAELSLKKESLMARIRNHEGACWDFVDLMPIRV